MGIFMLDGLVIGIAGTVLGTVGGLLLGWNIQGVAEGLEKLFGITVFLRTFIISIKFPIKCASKMLF